MRFIKEGLNIDFIGKQTIAITGSLLLILAGIVSVVMRQGLNYGIDFRGGTNVQIKFQQTVNLDELRSMLSQQKGGESAGVQTLGEAGENEVLLTLPVNSELGIGDALTANLQKVFSARYPNLEIRRIESIGPKVGNELKTSTLQAVAIAMGLMLIYLSLRFKWIFGVGAVVALFHDLWLVVGLFSILDKEITLSVIAALLTLGGYSVNDTIVIFDRIRENQAKFSRKNLTDVINLSVNETLSRTIMTSGVTLLVVIALFFLGGEIIHDFAFALLAGILVGTYSSIYIASPIVLFLSNKISSSSARASS